MGRRAALIALGSGTLLLAACASKPIRPANADGTWCHRVGKTPRYKLTCRLPPGEHALRATWARGEAQAIISGAAGEIRFLELVGSVWAWGSTYEFEPGDEASRDRVLRVRMVADVG
jgi:hypothetical protein